MVTGELVTLLRAVYSRPGFVSAISDTLGLQDPEVRDDLLEERAGSGGHEIRTWLIGAAAAGRPLAWASYEPVPESITGMGIGTTFAVPAA